MPPSSTSSSTSAPLGGALKTPLLKKVGYSYLGVRNTTSFKPILSSSKTVHKQNSDNVNPGPSVDVESEALEMLKVNYTSIYERLLVLPPILLRIVFCPHLYSVTILFIRTTLLLCLMRGPLQASPISISIMFSWSRSFILSFILASRSTPWTLSLAKSADIRLEHCHPS